MKKLLLVLAPLLLIGAGCQLGSGEQKILKENIVEKKDISFEKKQECAKYITEVNKRISDIDEESKNNIIIKRVSELKELFYSPKEDSCLYFYKSTGYDATYLIDCIKVEYVLKDVLTEKTISEVIDWKCTGEEILSEEFIDSYK
jgi:hypothetical protein